MNCDTYGILASDLLPLITSLLCVPSLGVVVQTCQSLRRRLGSAEFVEKLASQSYGIRNENFTTANESPLSISWDGFHFISVCDPRSLHCMTPSCLQAAHLAIQLSSCVPTADVYFGRGGSSQLREESMDTVTALAHVMAVHLKHNSGFRLKLFVAAHCGRGAPEFIQKSCTEERASSVCQTIMELLSGKVSQYNSLQMYFFGCKAMVTKRDIEESQQQLDFSRAELRLLAVKQCTEGEIPRIGSVGVDEDETVLLEWGRRWWEAQSDGGEVLPLPNYRLFSASTNRSGAVESSDESHSDSSN